MAGRQAGGGVMDLLENELVKKYFHVGCNDDPCYLAHNHDALRAVLVLQSMQQPIRKGDKFLAISTGPHEGDLGIKEHIAEADWWKVAIHTDSLRLPDRFQSQETPCFHMTRNMSREAPCPDCGKNLVWNLDLSAKPSPEKCQFNHGTGSECDCKPKDPVSPSAQVEEKIRNIANRFSGELRNWQVDELRELVALARES